MEKSKEAQKIIIQYSDGRQVVMNKGIAVHFAPSEEDPGSNIITLEMVSLSGEEVQDFIIAMVDLALRLEKHGGREGG